MTITHDTQIDFPAIGRSFGNSIAGVAAAIFRAARQWQLDLAQRRTIKQLPAHLQLDVGEIDHLPTPAQTFQQSEPSTYQDRLQQMWMR